MTTTRNRDKLDGKGKKEIYKDYLSQEPQSKVSQDDYFRIVEAVHKKAFDVMCERKYAVRLSNTIGSFYIKAYLPSKESHRVLDLKLTHEYGKKIYFKNSHSDGKRFRLMHKKKSIPFSLNHIFRFKASRQIQRTMAKLIKDKKIPSWI